MIRFCDILFSATALILFSPLFLFLSIAIFLDSKGPVFYFQERIGKNAIPFKVMKFRSMKLDADKHGLLTTSNVDSRITKIGLILRKYKLDELPQLINVLKGEMSLVGPRPEVAKYVAHYSEKDLEILGIRPGITDLASIVFVNENEILSKSENPEKTYIDEILPKKLKLNRYYFENRSLKVYFELIMKTISKILN